jgi:hypothetical protein
MDQLGRRKEVCPSWIDGKERVEAIALGSDPAIQIPRALFRAGIAWFCYTTFKKWDNAVDNTTFNNVDLRELKLFGTSPAVLLVEANEYISDRRAAYGPLPVLTDLLRRLGHWDIAQRLAAILAALINGGPDHFGSGVLPSEEARTFQA